MEAHMGKAAAESGLNSSKITRLSSADSLQMMPLLASAYAYAQSCMARHAQPKASLAAGNKPFRRLKSFHLHMHQPRGCR